jgi:hypothetical protein
MAPKGYSGSGGNRFMKKPEAENLVSDSLKICTFIAEKFLSDVASYLYTESSAKNEY